MMNNRYHSFIVIFSGCMMYSAPLSSVSLAFNPSSFTLQPVILLCLAIFFFRILWLSYWQKLNNDPQQPPIVPYIVPWLGSYFSFHSDFLEFIYYWSDHFKTKIFRMHSAGKSYLIVTDPCASALLIGGKYPQLSWNHGKFKICRNSAGMSNVGSISLSQRGESHKILNKNIGNPISLNNNLARSQKVIHDQIFPLISNNDWVEDGIVGFFGRAIFFFSANVFFNLPTLATEDNYDLIMKFDSKFAQFMVKNQCVSQILHREEYKARETVINNIKSSMSDMDTSKEKLSETFQQINDFDSQIAETSDLDTRARHLFLLFYASILNTVPTLFWIVYYLLSDGTIYDAVQKEVATIYEDRVKMNKVKSKSENASHLFELSDLQIMHNLDSLMLETFRLKSTAKNMCSRVATEDFQMNIPIDGAKKHFFVDKGTILITSPTLNHTDEEIFTDAKLFQWDRFLPLPDGTLPLFFKHGKMIRTPVNPFGGGKTLCPGKKFAIAEMKLIVAWMLLEYDLRFKGDKIPTTPDLRSPKNAPSNGMPTTDIRIEMRKR